MGGKVQEISGNRVFLRVTTILLDSVNSGQAKNLCTNFEGRPHSTPVPPEDLRTGSSLQASGSCRAVGLAGQRPWEVDLNCDRRLDLLS